MNFIKFKRFVLGVAVFAILVIAAVWWAATCKPTPQQDGMFLFSLGEAGIGYENSSTAITAGKGVCSALDSGASPAEIVNAIDAATQLNQRGAQVFVAISVGVFCQHHGDVVRPHLSGQAPKRL